MTEEQATTVDTEQTQDDAEQTTEEQTTETQQTFDRDYVEKLRKESAAYRTRAQRADTLAQKLLEATIKSTTASILADPDDLLANVDPASLLDDDGYPDAAKIETAANDLAARKPHLAERRPTGDIGAGARPEGEQVSLADIVRSRAG